MDAIFKAICTSSALKSSTYLDLSYAYDFLTLNFIVTSLADILSNEALLISTIRFAKVLDVILVVLLIFDGVCSSHRRRFHASLLDRPKSNFFIVSVHLSLRDLASENMSFL